MNPTPAPVSRAALAAAAVLSLYLSACSNLPTSSGPTALSTERISAVVASPDRSAADRAADARRKPEQLLAFIGVRPGMAALDLSAGGGYTTELLARALGPRGLVYSQSQPVDPKRAVPAGVTDANAAKELATAVAVFSPGVPPEARTKSYEAVALRRQHLTRTSAPVAAIYPVIRKFENPVPTEIAVGRLDLVTLMFNYHDIVNMAVNRDEMNSAVFTALKSGGVYLIADHAGRPGTGTSEVGTLHRIEEEAVIKEVQAAGFKLAAAGNFLRNPSDPRDQNTPTPPQAKDEFVLKFVKP